MPRWMVEKEEGKEEEEGGRVKLAIGSDLQSSLVRSDCRCLRLGKKRRVTDRECPLIEAYSEDPPKSLNNHIA